MEIGKGKTKETPLILDTREKVGEAFEILLNGVRFPPEKESVFLRAICTLDRLIARPSLRADELRTLRDSLAILGNSALILEALGSEGVKRCFGHLAGPDSDLPHCFPLPLENKDLAEYLDYELSSNDSAYQDQVALDYIDEPISSLSLNILVSKLRGNPDFMIRMFGDSRIHGGSENPYFFRFLEDAKKEPRFYKANLALSYLSFFTKRSKVVVQHDDDKENGKVLKAVKVRQKIQKMDEIFFRGLAKRP